MKLSTGLFIIVLLVWSVFCFAQVPRQISYQGYLTDNNNNPITNNLLMTFTLYDALSGGNLLWEEIHPSVSVTSGVFRVNLGSITPLNLSFDSPYWLGIKVGNLDLMPRIALTSVGYSLYSLKADSVNHLSEGSVTTTHIVDGSVTQSKLAAGTSLPPGGTAGGDLSGTYPNPTVAKIQGQQFSNVVPDTTQVLSWNGNMWTPGFGIVPIGTILPWVKSFPNTPALPECFVECNGQTIFDPASPYYQANVPDLNATNRFLRGGSASGSLGGSENHHHSVDIEEFIPPASGSSATAMTGSSNSFSRSSHSHYVDPPLTPTDTLNHLPPYYDVVWIVRIK